MKKLTFTSLFLIFALVLAACSPEDLEPFLPPVGDGSPTPLVTPVPTLTPGITPTPDEVVTTPAATPVTEMTPTPVAVEPTEPDPFRASNLMDAEVRGQDDQTVGFVTDYIADLNDNQVRYAVIVVTGEQLIPADPGLQQTPASPGDLQTPTPVGQQQTPTAPGQADPTTGLRQVLVPFEALEFAGRDNARFIFNLDVDNQQFEQAPDFDVMTVNFQQAGWDQQYRTYWADYLDDTMAPEVGVSPTPGVGVTPGPGETATPGIGVTPVSPTPATPAIGVTSTPGVGDTPTPGIGVTPVSPTPATPAVGVTPTPRTGDTPTPGVVVTPAAPTVVTEQYVLMSSLLSAAVTDMGEMVPGDVPGLPGQATPPPTQVPAPGAQITPTPGQGTPVPTVPSTPGDAVTTPVAPGQQETPATPGAPGQQETPAAPGAPLPTTPEGESLGFVFDVVMDPETGEILYLVVMTEEQQLAPVPVEAFTVQLTDHPVWDPAMVRLTIDREQLANAPTYDIGMLPDLSQPGWDAGLQDYWDQQ